MRDVLFIGTPKWLKCGGGIRVHCVPMRVFSACVSGYVSENILHESTESIWQWCMPSYRVHGECQDTEQMSQSIRTTTYAR